LPALWLLLEKIDRATLVAQRKLTIPFLKQILADQA
jgi:DnaA family protein